MQRKWHAGFEFGWRKERRLGGILYALPVYRDHLLHKSDYGR
jgi:hypothetical protein